MTAGKEIGRLLYYMKKPDRFSSGIGQKLPAAYVKFWNEWKVQKPAPIHYIEQEGTWIRNQRTGEVTPVQNVPINVRYPKEHNLGIWGGEGIVQGFQKRSSVRSGRIPHFWTPILMKSAVYSEVLDKYMRVIVTQRTIQLIHEHYGFDHYLLKTPACDLKSQLALRLKRNILIALADKTLYPDDLVKREEIYKKYEQYLTAYTREEIEWYGLTFKEAALKWKARERELNKVQPLKKQYRLELIDILKESKLFNEKKEEVAESESWISKVNPFAKSSSNTQ